MGSVVAPGAGVVVAGALAFVPLGAAATGAAAGAVVTTGVVTKLAVGSRPPRRPLAPLVDVTDAAGASASVVAGDVVRSAINDAAAANAASRAITTRLRLRGSGDRMGLVDGEGFI